MKALINESGVVIDVQKIEYLVNEEHQWVDCPDDTQVSTLKIGENFVRVYGYDSTDEKVRRAKAPTDKQKLNAIWESVAMNDNAKLDQLKGG